MLQVKTDLYLRTWPRVLVISGPGPLAPNVCVTADDILDDDEILTCVATV